MAIDGTSYASGSADTMFASKSVRVHLVRGAIGLSLMICAFALIPAFGPLMLLLIVPGAIALRGCPTCWALGLSQTIARDKVCVDGSCR